MYSVKHPSDIGRMFLRLKEVDPAEMDSVVIAATSDPTLVGIFSLFAKHIGFNEIEFAKVMKDADVYGPLDAVIEPRGAHERRRDAKRAARRRDEIVGRESPRKYAATPKEYEDAWHDAFQKEEKHLEGVQRQFDKARYEYDHPAGRDYKSGTTKKRKKNAPTDADTDAMITTNDPAAILDVATTVEDQPKKDSDASSESSTNRKRKLLHRRYERDSEDEEEEEEETDDEDDEDDEEEDAGPRLVGDRWKRRVLYDHIRPLALELNFYRMVWGFVPVQFIKARVGKDIHMVNGKRRRIDVEVTVPSIPSRTQFRTFIGVDVARECHVMCIPRAWVKDGASFDGVALANAFDFASTAPPIYVLETCPSWRPDEVTGKLRGLVSAVMRQYLSVIRNEIFAATAAHALANPAMVFEREPIEAKNVFDAQNIPLNATQVIATTTSEQDGIIEKLRQAAAQVEQVRASWVQSARAASAARTLAIESATRGHGVDVDRVVLSATENMAHILLPEGMKFAANTPTYTPPSDLWIRLSEYKSACAWTFGLPASLTAAYLGSRADGRPTSAQTSTIESQQLAATFRRMATDVKHELELLWLESMGEYSEFVIPVHTSMDIKEYYTMRDNGVITTEQLNEQIARSYGLTTATYDTRKSEYSVYEQEAAVDKKYGRIKPPAA